MVSLIPPYLGEEVKSNAERKVFEALKTLDLKNGYVLHSLGLPKHVSKVIGEADFVIVCERGIACLEVKGGRIECRNGKWIFINRYGEENVKTEGPFAQASGNMHTLRNIIRERFKNDMHIPNALFACGVVFPDIQFKADSQEIINEIIYDNSTDDVTMYIDQIFDYWQNRVPRMPSKLPPAQIKEIVEYLRGEFTFIPSLSQRIDEVERHLINLTSEQARILNGLSMNRHLMISGGAGTGKTVLAMEFAREKAAKGKKVLYLAYNKNLTRTISRQLSDEERENMDVINLHALIARYVKLDFDRMAAGDTDYYNRVLPEQFYDYLRGLSKDELEKIQYDVVVMDEGQDIIRPDFMFAIDLILKDGLENGEWAFFYDSKQNIYNPDYEEGIEILKSYNSASFNLSVNCRNTIQVGSYASEVSGIVIEEYLKENGEDVCIIDADTAESFKEKIKRLLHDLKSEDIDMNDVVFLAPRKYDRSSLKEAGIAVNELQSGAEYDPTRPYYSTIQGYKGLDSKVVILIDTEMIRKEDYSKMMYIAATRARTMLYVVRK